MTDNSYTVVEDAEVVVCDDCGAYAKTKEAVAHNQGCEPGESERWADYYNDQPDEDVQFFDPGGQSALRAGVRNKPCPTCGEPNKLTEEDVVLGYQCDACAEGMSQ